MRLQLAPERRRLGVESRKKVMNESTDDPLFANPTEGSQVPAIYYRAPQIPDPTSSNRIYSPIAEQERDNRRIMRTTKFQALYHDAETACEQSSWLGRVKTQTWTLSNRRLLPALVENSRRTRVVFFAPLFVKLDLRPSVFTVHYPDKKRPKQVIKRPRNADGIREQQKQQYYQRHACRQ